MGEKEKGSFTSNSYRWRQRFSIESLRDVTFLSPICVDIFNKDFYIIWSYSKQNNMFTPFSVEELQFYSILFTVKELK